ncbi:spore germination protein GerW family protein [Corallococcus sp. EGB]|uniref:spore germination protein GerW family protein n=1 Tax=Corallococcus sp. EGB TaxID=1521117 RepID=UPI001CBA6CAF|nr:spore germination protein GerW family protein [Corallococcus sp. EGB]
MDIIDLIDRTRDSISARCVFGHPIQQGDVTVIPVARVRGGGGGGGGEGSGHEGTSREGTGHGEGTGFGLSARPSGVFVIRGDRVSWLPVVEPTRIILGLQALAGIGLLAYTLTRRRGR